MGTSSVLSLRGLLLLALCSCISAQSVLQYHNSGYRSGLYVDPLFNSTNLATLALDPTFNVSIPGPVFAQTLYLTNGTQGRDIIFVATEQNQVLAIDARNGTTVWNRTMLPPVNGAILPCGNIDPAGITGTPVIDTGLGVMAFVSLTTPNNTVQGVRSLAYALNLTTGAVLPGWPVDIQAKLTAQNKTFIAANQQQRGALTVLNDTVYIPYGGLNGDCNEYYGVVVGIPLRNSSSVTAYFSAAYKGGLWSAPGVSTDGTNIYGASGNTGSLDGFVAPPVWSGGEGVLRFQPGPVFTNATQDFFSPANWQALDDADTDIGSSGALLVDLPGATPNRLVFAMGKNGVVYMINRENLGGVGGQIFDAQVNQGVIITTPVAYNTTNGTYIALGGRTGLGCPAGQSGDIIGLRLTAGSPPNFTVAWCASSLGAGRVSLIATSPDGNSTATVWALGAGGSGLLRGFDGATGRLVYNGTTVFSALSSWQTPIVSKGRLYFADNTRLYRFQVAGAPTLPLASNTTTNATLPSTASTSTNGTSTNATRVGG